MTQCSQAYPKCHRKLCLCHANFCAYCFYIQRRKFMHNGFARLTFSKFYCFCQSLLDTFECFTHLPLVSILSFECRLSL